MDHRLFECCIFEAWEDRVRDKIAAQIIKGAGMEPTPEDY